MKSVIVKHLVVIIVGDAHILYISGDVDHLQVYNNA